MLGEIMSLVYFGDGALKMFDRYSIFSELITELELYLNKDFIAGVFLIILKNSIWRIFFTEHLQLIFSFFT